MKKQSNTPEIRFQNYEDKWDIEKLINIFGTIRNAFVGTATPYYVEKGHFYLESNNVKNGKINYNSQIFINDEFYEKQRDKWLKTNDIVMVQSGHVGHTAVIPEELNNTAAHALIVFTDYKKEVNPHFLNYQFQSNGKRKKLDLISTGNTIKHILASEMKDFKMDFPTFEEQSAIGSLFRTLDELLTSYKDNLANYQSLKVTMLSKMFPKTGQTVPEIRLDGFEGEWEEKYIGELADIVRGASPRPIQDPKWFDPNSEIGWLRISDVTSQNGRIHSLEQKISKLGQEKTRVLTEPHLLLSIAATVGKPVVNYVKTGVHDGFLIFMNPKFDREFMFQWLEMYREKWNRYGQPGSQVNLNSDIVKNQKILVPCMEEQQAIGSYFSNLDNLINSHQEKISQLETLKKKLLQDMFI